MLRSFGQVQLLVSDNDVKSYKQIKDDLDDLRLLVEKSELWVYKAVKLETDKKVSCQTLDTIPINNLLSVSVSVCLSSMMGHFVPPDILVPL